jgi:nucleoside-diphosphate-sugar epimerase
MRSLAGRPVVVTGAAGFIGSHLTRRLIAMDCHVLALVRPGSNLWRIGDVLDRLEVMRADLADLEKHPLPADWSDTEVLYHLAAAGVDPQRHDAAAMLATNVTGTLRTLQAAHAAGVGRFVYCGSCFEYGPGMRQSEDAPPTPNSEYGASKAAAWMLVHAFGRRYSLPVVSLRPFTAYGPCEARHRLVPYTITRAIDGSSMDFTSGDQTRDFVFVEDVVDAFLRAAIAPEATGETFNVCSGLATSVRDVVSTILEMTGSTVVPRFGTRPHRETEIGTLSGDPSRAAHRLRWRATTPLQEGLQKTIHWFREHQSLVHGYG